MPPPTYHYLAARQFGKSQAVNERRAANATRCEARRTPTGEMQCFACKALWDIDEERPDQCIEKQGAKRG